MLTINDKWFIIMAETKKGQPKGWKVKRMKTRAWKVYGIDGHRQRESFGKSYKYDFSEGTDVRIIEVDNFDKTGTNEYSIIHITRNSSEECEEELRGQLSDGIFENSRVGKVVEI